MHEQNITKRRFLTLLGASAGAVGLGSSEGRAASYSNTVDIVKAGADNTGSRSINGVLEDVIADDTLIQFPPGTYLMDRELDYSNARNVGLVGTGGSSDTTIIIKDSFADENIFDFGSSGSVAADGIQFQGFTIDFTDPGAGAGVFWAYCHDGVHVEDIVIDGLIEGPHPSGKGEIFMRVDVIDSAGSGLIKNVRVLQGARYVGSGDPATGIYIGGAHAGSITIEDCELTGFQDNGVYTSPAANAGGHVTIRGGHYYNNDVSNVRVGGASTLVENVTITQDSTDRFIYNNPRGIYGRTGNATIRNVDITYAKGASEAIHVGVEMESIDLQDVRIHQTTDETTCRFFNSSASSPSFTMDGVTVVAEGSGNPVLTNSDWDGSVSNSCFQVIDSSSRDGLMFDAVTAAVNDTTVNVPGTAIAGASTTNISYDDTCSLTSGSGGGGSTSSGGVGEVGTLATNQSSASEWHSVGLDDSYDSPVVLAGPLSSRGPHPAHVRLDNVGSSGFQFQIEEWDYLNGSHKSEIAHYLATSAGTHSLDGGNLLEAGTTTTSHQWKYVDLNAGFEKTPVVIADTQTANGWQAVNTRLTMVGTGGFYVRAQESEDRGWHKDERIGYAAFEPGTDKLDGQPMEANTTLTVVDDSWTRIDFEGYYEEPEFVATVQSFRGWNPIDLRYRNLTGTSVEVRLQEEQSNDWETNHTVEQVGYVVVDDS